MFVLSTIDYNADGSVVYRRIRKPKTTADAARRVSRVPTLDGGVVPIDSGYSEGDRTFELYTDGQNERWTTARDTFLQQTLLYLAIDEGFYSGVIERIQLQDGELYIKFLPIEKIA